MHKSHRPTRQAAQISKQRSRLIKEAKSQDAELIAFPEFLMAFSPANQSAEELTQSPNPSTALLSRRCAKLPKRLSSVSWRRSMKPAL